MNAPSPADPFVSETDRRGVLRKVRRLPRVSLASFLVALVLLIVATPFVQELEQGRGVEAVLMSVVLCTGFIALGSRRRTHGLGLVLVTVALAARWIHHAWPERCSPVYFLVPAVAFLLLMMGCLLLFVLRASKVDSEVLCAGISIYLLMGLLWGFLYLLIAQISPAAFTFSTPPGPQSTMTGFTAVYFSFITLTTVGYGDITPVSPAARMLAMMEAMTGTLFVGVLIARLVSLYSAPQPPSNQNDSPETN
jgi:hypothetical protein